jgi:hypothetical protein
MVSQINPSLPVTGLPTTISVRENFGIARDEISALQAGGPFLPLTGGNALLTGGWFVVRHGANPGLTIENTGAGPVFALQVGGNPATLWFRTVNSATNAPVTNLAAISSTGKFSVLGGASDPFELTVPSGMSARAWFTITGTRTWSVGPRADGAFEIADQTGLIGRIVIGTGGLLQYFGSATVNGALTVDGAVSLLQGGTSGPLIFSGGLAPPAVDGRSAGTRLVLFPAGGSTELALGIMAGGMWFSCRTSNDFFSWYAGANEIATLAGNGTFRIMGDFVLNRQDAATGWITRPNVAGFRNLGFAAAGGGPLDTLTINAAETSISGNLNVTGTIIGGNIATKQYIDDALAALRAELSRGD